VDVIFADTSLRKCYVDHKAAVRKWGQKISKRYVMRVNVLQAVKSAQELHTFPELKFHPLTGDRKGQYALSLDGAWRLIVTFSDSQMKVVRVEEVTDHYGD
jgi:proteic killer suppression protein